MNAAPTSPAYGEGRWYASADLSGQVFGRLTVKKRIGTHFGSPLWECVCVCGGERTVSSAWLRIAKDHNKSCGCLKRETKHARATAKPKCACGNIAKRRDRSTYHRRCTACIGKGIYLYDPRPVNKGTVLIDMVGQTFGRITITHRHGVDNFGTATWSGICACGNPVVGVVGTSLRRGDTKSCGCLHLEGSTTHGLSKHPLFSTWSSMNSRCHKPGAYAYENYGGRGITVCARWRRDHDGGGLKNFIADMGKKPEGTSLDRIDNNGNYEPSNCRWATNEQQSQNRRPSISNAQHDTELVESFDSGFEYAMSLMAG